VAGLWAQPGCRGSASQNPGQPRGGSGSVTPPTVSDSRPDGGRGGQGAADTAPDLLVWASDLAVREGDMASARRILAMALAKLGGTLSTQPAAGFFDATLPPAMGRGGRGSDGPGPDPEAEIFSEVAANGSVIAIAHGSLLSAVDLRQSYRLLRLPTHAATIRQIKVSADGRRVASFADDQILRLFALPTGALLLELPLSLDFLAIFERRHADLFAFSPDSRRLFALDCGERSGPACPLLRLRSFACERGERHGEIALPAEPIEYSSRSDGTLSVLPTGGAPRFYDASSGMEWPQTAPPPRAAAPAAAAGAPATGDAAPALCRGAHYTSGRGRPWLISPERHWLVTLASPTLLCLWDAVEHKLARAVPLPRPLSGAILLSLLADARAVVLADSKTAMAKGADKRANAGAGSGSGLGPVPQVAELLELGSSAATASAAGAGRRPQKLPYPLSVLPLDGGGALWTVVPARQAAETSDDDDSPAAAEQPVPDGELCLIAGERVGDRNGTARCLQVPGLWRQADPHYGPLATSGDGRFAFFGSLQPLLVDTQAHGSSRAATLIALPAPAVSPRVENAEILDDGRLLTLFQSGELRAYSLPSAELSYVPPQPTALRRLDAKDDAWLMERTDGTSLVLSLESASLRRQSVLSGGLPEVGVATAPPAAQDPVLTVGENRLYLLPGGALLLHDRRPGGGRLRLQFLPEVGAGPGGAGERRAPAAVVVASDGRFERIGEASPSDIEPYVICRAGPYQAPLALCAERLETRGLLVAALAAFRPGKAAPAPPAPRP
jgi:hypothetical protein